jgi:4-diphosphocytidyl-2-C-methyl-D-erythritol kinase
MSGSGATCFGIYPTIEAANTAAREISAAHPAWWVKPASLYQ